MAYNAGFGAVQQAIEKSNTGSSTFFTWKDGESKIVRLLTDDVIPIGFHSFIPGLDGKNHNFVCSEQLAEPRECVICKNITIKGWKGEAKKATPSTQTVGIAVLREEKPIPGGGVEIVDAKGDDGKPVIGLIQQSNNNFWAPFTGYFARYGTTVDRDYEIKRSGSKTDTKYLAVPCEVEENLRVKNDAGRTDIPATRELVAKTYEKAMEGQRTVVEFIEGLGSKEYYDKFVGNGIGITDSEGNVLTKGSNDSETHTHTDNVPTPSSNDNPAQAQGGSGPVESNDTQFSSLRDKLQGYQAANS